jgi:hypothetical protein
MVPVSVYYIPIHLNDNYGFVGLMIFISDLVCGCLRCLYFCWIGSTLLDGRPSLLFVVGVCVNGDF